MRKEDQKQNQVFWILPKSTKVFLVSLASERAKRTGVRKIVNFSGLKRTRVYSCPLVAIIESTELKRFSAKAAERPQRQPLEPPHGQPGLEQ
jgi:hypothetical protein